MTTEVDLIKESLSTLYFETESEIHNEITSKQWALFREVAAVKPGQSILDVGCGAGVAIQGFLDDGLMVTALSPNSDEMKVVYDKFGTKINGLVFPLEQLPSVDTVYDLIWARHSLEHCTNPLLALRIIRQSLRDGGWAYLEFPAPDTSSFHESNANHYSVLGKRMWACLIAKAGLTERFHGDINFKTMAGDDTYFYFIVQRVDNAAEKP